MLDASVAIIDKFAMLKRIKVLLLIRPFHHVNSSNLQADAVTHWYAEHVNAIPCQNNAPTAEDWEISVIIWRCRECQHQWFNVAGLVSTFAGIYCPHCNIPMKRLSWPPSLPPAQPISAKAPPINAVPKPSSFGLVVGPEESSLPAPSIGSSSGIGAAYKLSPGQIASPALA